MLSKLFDEERETLLLFSKDGSGGAYDLHALNKLFTLRVLTIGERRRVVLTIAGRRVCDQIQALKDTHHD